jgi:MFS family permease
MATALPAIVHDLGGSQSFAWVSSAYSLATTAIIPFSGRLAEIFGRRHILLLSLLIFAAGSLICSLAHSMVVLIVGRG